MAQAASDFMFLMDREEIPSDLVEKFKAAGINSVRLLAAFVTDADAMRTSLKEDFGVDTSVLAGKVTAGKVVVAWELAKARSAKFAEIEAETELRQEAKPIRQTDFKSMHEAYEAKWWKLEKKQIPSRVYVERVSDGVEKGEPRAELLSEVTNYEEGDSDLMKAVFDPSGSIKAIKTASTIPLPKDPEELRLRVALLGRAWSFVGFQQPNCPWLKGMGPQVFQEYLDYLLGPHVFRLVARDEFGRESANPPWNLLLSYELEIRRKAMSMVTDLGTPFAKALKEAYENPIVKERYFTTPLALATTVRSGKRAFDQVDNDGGKGRKGDKGRKGKGKGKKGKGRGKDSGGCKSETPDGAKICYSFNQAKGCKRANCSFLHVCGKCFQEHSMLQCPN